MFLQRVFKKFSATNRTWKQGTSFINLVCSLVVLLNFLTRPFIREVYIKIFKVDTHLWNWSPIFFVSFQFFICELFNAIFQVDFERCQAKLSAANVTHEHFWFSEFFDVVT